MFFAMTFSDVLPWAVFGSIAAGAWMVFEFVTKRNTRASERLEEMLDPSVRAKRERERETAAKKTDAMSRVLSKAKMAARPLQPRSEADANKLKARLMAAGFRSESAPSVFLGLKFIALIIGFVAGGGTMLILNGISQKTLLGTVFGAGVAFYIPEFALGYMVKKRKKKIFLGLPDALDLLVVCVEAGLGLDQAMRKVAEEMKDSCPTIAEELALCNFQLQMGRSRNEVLHELGTRTQVDDLRQLAAILIQADKFGSSIAQALRVQSDSMRIRRRQLAEEKAAKTAVKLIFPLVLFIFPGIFVVLVGPAAITIVNEMFPRMGG
jgi:tight adherence protein C